MTMLRAFGAPHRYVQGPGALAQLEPLANLYGAKRPFVIADAVVQRLLLPRLRAGLGAVAEGITVAEFGGECTADEIDRLAEAARAAGADMIIGVGGGKAIDTAKGVHVRHGRPLFIVPTIASNDSPTSRLVVVYTREHVLHEVRAMTANPDVVLVDTEVLIAAPERFFVSGVGDALSKKFEAAQCLASGGNNFYSARPSLLASTIADACYDTIRAHAERALEAVRARKVNEDFERTVEATILLSGLAFENGGLSIAHSLTRGFSVVPGVANALHGEQVAFGLLVQLVLEQRPAAFLAELEAFYARMGLPRSLNDLGLRGDPEEAARKIAQDTWARAPYVKALTSPIDVDRLAAAILEAHRLGSS
jgi:glycerol dehydrogenase